VLLTWAGA
jgi:antibiotic biosynthesis monooxygenase (ABM) superfamily enzyme